MVKRLAAAWSTLIAGEASGPTTLSVEQMSEFVGGVASEWSGEKFLGGFGVTKDYF